VHECQVGAEDVKRLKSLESSVAAAEKELEKLQGSASGLQGQAQQLQAQIDNVGGEPLKKRKSKVESLQEVMHPLPTLPPHQVQVQPTYYFCVHVFHLHPSRMLLSGRQCICQSPAIQ